MLFLYKLLNGLLDVNAANFFNITEPHHYTRSHDTRIRSKLPLRTQNQNNFNSNRCVIVWNLLPSDIVAAPNYSIFKMRLKLFDLSTVTDLLF